MNANVDNISSRLNTIADILYNGNKSAFGRDLGMTPQALNSYLKGDRAPGFEIQSKINAIGVSINWLIHGEGDIFDPHKLPPDKQFKRLFILRHRSQVFHGTPRIAAEMLGVEVDTYSKWETGQLKIPPGTVDKIYTMISDHISEEWWYKGTGDIYSSSVNSIDNVEYGPEIPLFESLKEQNLSSEEAQILDEVTQFSEFLRRRPLRPAVKRVLLERLIESIDQALEQPQHEVPRSDSD